MAVTVLGIRHHGAGSARNVLAMLKKLQPDLVMVEGPPELEPLMSLIGQKDLKTPVSLLCYDEQNLRRAAFYPFAEFSPEWVAAAWANEHKVPLRCLDLPLALSWEKFPETPDAQTSPEQVRPRDPLSYLAEIAGFDDTERWWELQFEQRTFDHGPEEHFEAVMLAMKTLRDAEIPSHLDAENLFREAYMAQLIRKSNLELYQNIVVVCGAWHAPALLDLDKTEKEHVKILGKLPKSKIKVGVTWVPWTSDRLSMQSGYGAGLASPGWYEHLWKHPDDMGVRWLTRVAQLLRKKKMDISTAHVIESVRLGESVAALRGLSRPGLLEMNEATQTVMCMGDGVLLELVRKELVVGVALGKTPENLPKLPLQADFEETARKLRLPFTAEGKELDLDLRQELDLKRSVFFNRLSILGIPWAKSSRSRSRGTFRESWVLKWEPEMMIALIDKGVLGNSVEDAATVFLREQSERTTSVGDLSGMINRAIPAELFEAVSRLLKCISDSASVSTDILEMMQAIGPLADTGRYGNVRSTDQEAIRQLVSGLLTRVCIGLPNACYGLDDASSEQMFVQIRSVHEAVQLLDMNELREAWLRALQVVAEKDGVHALLHGCCTRLLLDGKWLDADEVASQFSRALSVGNDPMLSAYWMEGFLKGSGLILLYDAVLWNLLYQWVGTLPEEAFVNLLPILRRTFSKFEPGERKQLGEKAKKGQVNLSSKALEAASDRFDAGLAAMPLDFIAGLLG
ncbi:MAG: hypothetical protein J0M29_08750 [Chitinophagales bacterium]|nr:hypothetical protein [Chitinophagales bacterium]